MYHSNKCGAIYGRKRNGNMIVQRKRTKVKEIEEKVMGKVLAVNLDSSLRNNTS